MNDKMSGLLRKSTNKNSIVNRDDDHPQFVMSDSSPDRYNDIVRASGWKTKKFERNPICLFNHDSGFVCGKWVDVHVEGNRLLGRFKAAPDGTSARIDEVLKLIDAGIINSCSVGFLPIKSKALASGGTEYLEQELVECSIVPVPANANAMMIAARQLGVSEAMIQRVFREPVDGTLAQRQAWAKARLKAHRAKTAETFRKIDATNARIAARRAKQAAHDARHRQFMREIDAEMRLDLEVANAKTPLQAIVIADQQERAKQEKIDRLNNNIRQTRNARIGAVLKRLNDRGHHDAAQEIMQAQLSGDHKSVEAMLVDAIRFLNGR